MTRPYESALRQQRREDTRSEIVEAAARLVATPTVDVKVGDVVIYSKYGGTEVKYNGVEYLLLGARDILAIVEK